MARTRALKPEFWQDRKLARKLSRDERMLYMGLWNQSDEHGRADGDPDAVKAAVFPFEADLDVDAIDAMLDRLHVARVIYRYEIEGEPFLFLPKLGNHQRLEPKRVPSRRPAPPSEVRALRLNEEAQEAENLLVDGELNVVHANVFARHANTFAPRSHEAAFDAPKPLVEAESEASEDGLFEPDADDSLAGAIPYGDLKDKRSKDLKRSCSSAAPTNVSDLERPVAVPKSAKPADPPHFVEFWEIYPRRSNRPAAIKAFVKASKVAELQTILDGARRYADDPNRVAQYTAHAATWLNGERWEDDPLPGRNARTTEQSGPARSDQKVQNILDIGSRITGGNRVEMKEITQ